MAETPLNELQELIARHAGADVTTFTSLPSLMLISSRAPCSTMYVAGPQLAVIVQGKKEIFLGRKVYPYGPCHYTVLTVDLPMQTKIVDVDSEVPLLGLCLTLKRQRVAELLTESGDLQSASTANPPLVVSELETALIDALVRYLRLLEQPDDIPIMENAIEREILWRLLRGPQGASVRQFGLADSRVNRISEAIRFIRENFSEDIRVEDMAKAARMSVTSFHRNFQSITSMSPIQYQKEIRLQAARSRLLAGEGDSIAEISFAVGFNSPSQFSRDYRRLFGESPRDDVRSASKT